MRLSEVEKLLDDHNIGYELSLVENRGEFYRSKGFTRANDDQAFVLLTIPNPNHSKNIELIFKTAGDNPEFSDLEFGGYWFELLDREEEMLPDDLVNGINYILSGKLYVIFARDARTRAWLFDGAYSDSQYEEQMNMIKKPKGWWKKLRGISTQYEIFNWISYECIIN